MSAYLWLQMESKSLGSSIDEVPELHQLFQLAAHQGLPLVGLVLVFFLHGMYAGAGIGAQGGEREAVEDLVQAQLRRPPHPLSFLAFSLLSATEASKLYKHHTRACRLQRANKGGFATL